MIEREPIENARPLGISTEEMNELLSRGKVSIRHYPRKLDEDELKEGQIITLTCTYKNSNQQLEVRNAVTKITAVNLAKPNNSGDAQIDAMFELIKQIPLE